MLPSVAQIKSFLGVVDYPGEGCYSTDDASLCECLDDELREDIAELAEARGETAGGTVDSAIRRLRDQFEGRIIEFRSPQHARDYYRHHHGQELEYAGALEQLTPEPYGEHAAQPVDTTLNAKQAEAREKANAAARWLAEHDSETRVVMNDHGSPESIPELDQQIEVQHGAADEEVSA